MKRQAIRHEGDKAEKLFLDLVAHSREPTEARKGDVEVAIEEEWHYVEIKECHSNTINQVRAIKYIPLVIYAPEEELSWVVIPPHELALLVSDKPRGQHNEIPFECATLTLSSLPEEFLCQDEQLEEMVIRAIRLGKQNPRYRETMERLLNELSSMNEFYKKEVRSLQPGNH